MPDIRTTDALKLFGTLPRSFTSMDTCNFPHHTCQLASRKAKIIPKRNALKSRTNLYTF
jgi:hypothetical protein